MLFRREEMFTDVKEVNKDNVADIVREAMKVHKENAQRIEYLLKYEAGEQPIARKKKYRSDIDCKCVDNVANEITDFKLNYNWGNPITLVTRKKVDEKDGKAEAVSMLNSFYESENYKAKQQELARFVEICGVGCKDWG